MELPRNETDVKHYLTFERRRRTQYFPRSSEIWKSSGQHSERAKGGMGVVAFNPLRGVRRGCVPGDEAALGCCGERRALRVGDTGEATWRQRNAGKGEREWGKEEEMTRRGRRGRTK